MYTRSENCPRRELCIQNGKGLVELKDLTDQEGLYGHGRMFAHVTIRPGCSIGDHPHVHETEFYYILKGDPTYPNGLVTVSENLTKAEVNGITTQPKLTFTAYAVQKDGIADAATAWAKVPTTTP